MTARLNRRDWLAQMQMAALGLVGCRADETPLAGGWVGAAAQRGHRLRTLKSGALPVAAVQRRAHVLVIGAGVAGLAAARALGQAGIDDVHLLELEDEAGGNARGHRMAGMDCPLGAHYLPVPGDEAAEVCALLADFGLARFAHGRWVWDERHLCHSPQERLFFEGAWHEGLLPPAEPGSDTLAQYRRFSLLVSQAQREVGFSMPALHTPWTAAHAALEAVTFADWLGRHGLDDARLRWYLDYCCRDDYGADAATVSAWAGLHYFASRHGFHPPGDEEAEREPVLTWPEGNAWLTRRMAAPLADRLHTGRTALQVIERLYEVEVLVWNEATGQAERWTAHRVVLALPVFIAARLMGTGASEALREVAAQAHHAPWLVANLHLDAPLLPRLGTPSAWDSIAYGSTGLGYVDALHQSLRPHAGPTVLTAYLALPVAQRAALLADDWRPWAQRVIGDLAALHPDLPQRLQRIDLMRYGHAMRVPLPGTRTSPAHQALSNLKTRVTLAHADLAGYSVFEEAYTLGVQAGFSLARTLRRSRHA
ncbi:FAD-dependent oxidoreductase [Sphaerotilus sp.]|uniref:FAD-dependent oxidoreductase n=1 Tax=Sphaerotilus sp. TaxID=2093942 RepID=UPI002ACDC8CE|nr:FAD-dependent oxidoreductase [Sphaerotilus sp.]MDZ7854872.1 FAD-dependent oxidoreductase [Sphaerotilus sp.]